MSGLHRLNYVVAAYFGQRHVPDPAYDADRSFFLRRHLESLARLDHKLTQITVVVSGDDPMDFSLGLPDRIRNTPVVTLKRPNEGLSYGAYSDAFAICGDSFDSFIFIEDDYVFTHDHFDALLLEELEARPSCGQLCATTFHNRDRLLGELRKDRFAAFSVSICRSEALEKARINAYSSCRRLYYANTNDYEEACRTQMRQSFSILDAGYTVEDWLSRWAAMYWEGSTQSAFWFGDPEKRSMVVPVQSFGREVLISERLEWEYGRAVRAKIDEQGYAGKKEFL